MRKSFALLLFSFMLLTSLVTLCSAEEKTKSVDILMKYAPFFGHIFDTEEFTYIGIFYPSFIYDKKHNKLTVSFEKIDERTVDYSFELDCLPFLPLKKQIQVEGRTFTAIQPENYSSVRPDTIHTFVGTVGKEAVFGFPGKRIKEWTGSDWSLHMPKPKDILSGPNERENFIDEFTKEPQQFYPSLYPFLESLSTLKGQLLLKAVKAARELENKLASDAIQRMTKEASPDDPPELPIIIPELELPSPIPPPDQCFRKTTPSFIQFLKTEIIEPDIANIIARLPFRPDPRKVYVYVYLPTYDDLGVLGNTVFVQYKLGLKEIEFHPDVRDLEQKK